MPINVLLVEDNRSDARMIQELVKGNGGRQVSLRCVDRVSTAYECLHSEKPDVLILDLSLPDSKGLATFRQICSRAVDVPIIVLTGLDDVDMAVQTIAEGAADYLVKSDLSSGLLVRVLHYGIERKRIENNLRQTQRELAFKNRIAGIFLTAPDLDMSAGVVSVTLEFMQSEEGVFGYIDEDGALVCPATARANEQGTRIVHKNGRFPRETWSGSWGRALIEKRPLFSNEPEQMLDIPVRRTLAVPLMDDGELAGLFQVANKTTDYGEQDRDFLARAATYLAPILHARLQRNRHERALSNALAAKEILLKEVHHRVKNNLQVISSLLNMQADGLPHPAQSALIESQTRVRSMALVHEQLYSGEQPDQMDFGEYISSLSADLFDAYHVAPELVRLRLDLEPVLLKADLAMPCGLILSELLTNALKYAFPEGRSGEILVTLHQDEGRISLRVSDNGVGLPPAFDCKRSHSLGLHIVDILTRQLNGTLDCKMRPGANFTLTFAAPKC